MAEPIMLPGGNQVPVVGESHYQPNLDKVCGGRTRDGHWVDCTAILVPEPTNPYDPHAVAICVDGQHVGYLSREAAQAFIPVTQRLAGRMASCSATIRGGWDRPGDQGQYSVTLDLAGPGHCVNAIQEMTFTQRVKRGAQQGTDAGERTTAWLERNRFGIVRKLGRFNRKHNPNKQIRERHT